MTSFARPLGRGRSAALAAVLGTALMAGCGIASEDAPRTLAADAVPFDPDPAPPPAPEGDGKVALYFLNDDDAVLSVRAVAESLTPVELVDLLLAGPAADEPTGLTTDLSPLLNAASAERRGDTLIVDLEGPSEAIGQLSSRAFAQLVATLVPSQARAVAFTASGEPVGVIRSDGTTTFQPVTRRDFADTIVTGGPGPR